MHLRIDCLCARVRGVGGVCLASAVGHQSRPPAATRWFNVFGHQVRKFLEHVNQHFWNTRIKNGTKFWNQIGSKILLRSVATWNQIGTKFWNRIGTKIWNQIGSTFAGFPYKLYIKSMCQCYLLASKFGADSLATFGADNNKFGTKLVPNFGTKLVPKFRTIIDSRIPIFFEFRVRKTQNWYQILVPNWYQNLEPFLIHVFQKCWYTCSKIFGSWCPKTLNQRVAVGGRN